MNRLDWYQGRRGRCERMGRQLGRRQCRGRFQSTAPGPIGITKNRSENVNASRHLSLF